MVSALDSQCGSPRFKSRPSHLLIFSSHPEFKFSATLVNSTGEGGGVLPYICYIGMCHCEGYSFQAVYSSIGYINQSVWV